MRGVFFRILILVGLTAYFILAGTPLHQGFTYVQRWTLDLQDRGEDRTDSPERTGLPFMTVDYFGYTDPDGLDPLVMPLREGIALGPIGYCTYDPEGEVLALHNPVEGSVRPLLPLSGYPHATGEYFFLLSHDMTGFSLLNGEGDLLFRSCFSSLISSLDRGETLISAGLLNGEAHLFNLQGNLIEVLTPEGSRIKAVYGTAVSRSGGFVALTHGIDPQVLSLYGAQGGSFKRIRSFTLHEALRSQVVMGFSRDELLLFTETMTGFTLLHTSEPYTRRDIALEGQLVDFRFSMDGKQLFVLTSRGEESLLYCFSSKGTLLTREVFLGQGTWLRERENSIFLGLDNRLTRIDVIGEEL
jgi:hypothetical protein